LILNLLLVVDIVEPEVSIYREPSDHEEEEEEDDTAERLQKLLQEKLKQKKKEAEVLRMKVRHTIGSIFTEVDIILVQ
jgi:fructose-bisphosphate aldolase class 1